MSRARNEDLELSHALLAEGSTTRRQGFVPSASISKGVSNDALTRLASESVLRKSLTASAAQHESLGLLSVLHRSHQGRSNMGGLERLAMSGASQQGHGNPNHSLSASSTSSSSFLSSAAARGGPAHLQYRPHRGPGLSVAALRDRDREHPERHGYASADGNIDDDGDNGDGTRLGRGHKTGLGSSRIVDKLERILADPGATLPPTTTTTGGAILSQSSRTAAAAVAAEEAILERREADESTIRSLQHRVASLAGDLTRAYAANEELQRAVARERGRREADQREHLRLEQECVKWEREAHTLRNWGSEAQNAAIREREGREQATETGRQREAAAIEASEARNLELRRELASEQARAAELSALAERVITERESMAVLMAEMEAAVAVYGARHRADRSDEVERLRSELVAARRDADLAKDASAQAVEEIKAACYAEAERLVAAQWREKVAETEAAADARVQETTRRLNDTHTAALASLVEEVKKQSSLAADDVNTRIEEAKAREQEALTSQTYWRNEAGRVAQDLGRQRDELRAALECAAAEHATAVENARALGRKEGEDAAQVRFEGERFEWKQHTVALEADLDRLRQQLQAQKREAGTQATRREELIRDLQSQLREQQTLLDHERERYSSLERDLATAHEKAVAERDAVARSADGRVSELRNEYAELQRERDRQSELNVALREEIATLKAREARRLLDNHSLSPPRPRDGGAVTAPHSQHGRSRVALGRYHQTSGSTALGDVAATGVAEEGLADSNTFVTEYRNTLKKLQSAYRATLDSTD